MSGPIPLHRYRAFKRTKADERAERIRRLADQLGLPIAALAGSDVLLASPATEQALEAIPRQPFDAQAHEYHYPSAIAAKLAIADDLAKPLTRLTPEERGFIEQVLAETLNRRIVLERVRGYFRQERKQQGEQHAS